MSAALDSSGMFGLDEAMLTAAVTEAQEGGGSTLDFLEKRSGLGPVELTAALARALDYRALGRSDLARLEPAFDLLAHADATRRNCLVARSGKSLLAIVADPFDAALRSWLEVRVPQALEWVLAPRAEIAAYLSRNEQSLRALDSAVAGNTSVAAATGGVDNLSLASISLDSSPIVKLVHSTLYDALRAGASDVHLETVPNGLVVRYRIDGVLVHMAAVTGAEVSEQVVSRIKVMAELDIAERRVPQDGSFRVHAGGRDIDLRLSVMPSVHGEDAVIRILDKQAMVVARGALSLDTLGFDEGAVRALRRMADQPHGMLLVTGPTGSGKTTTLYASLGRVDTAGTNILTVEDPVEYELAGIGQTQVNPKIDLTFAKALRAILRQDPDVIMIGEIRDYETAQIAIQASLTGHLVLATVHTNDAPSTVSRLIDMGVEPFLLSSSLLGVLAQRLVRKLCVHCKKVDARGRYHPVGCAECTHTGYKGRTGVYELMVADDKVRSLIHSRAAESQIFVAAEAAGLRSMREDGERLVAEGITSPEEVMRVTRE